MEKTLFIFCMMEHLKHLHLISFLVSDDDEKGKNFAMRLASLDNLSETCEIISFDVEYFPKKTESNTKNLEADLKQVS